MWKTGNISLTNKKKKISNFNSMTLLIPKVYKQSSAQGRPLVEPCLTRTDRKTKQTKKRHNLQDCVSGISGIHFTYPSGEKKPIDYIWLRGSPFEKQKSPGWCLYNTLCLTHPEQVTQISCVLVKRVCNSLWGLLLVWGSTLAYPTTPYRAASVQKCCPVLIK